MLIEDCDIIAGSASNMDYNYQACVVGKYFNPEKLNYLVGGP
jgi:hypothetical protein